MSAAQARRTGQKAEKFAEKWLRRRGLAPVFRNYSCRAGELDLVMQAEGQLVVVEVKYRRLGALVSAAESVTAAKQKRLARATLHLLQKHPQLAELPVRFDLLAVGPSASQLSGRSGDDDAVEWIRDAFRPAL